MLLALGDWTDKVGQNTAHRYAALSCAKSLEHYKSWEEIPPEVLRDITNVAADHVTEALRLDCIRVWELPNKNPEDFSAIRLSAQEGCAGRAS